MRERFNGFRQVVSQRKIVINVPLLATTIAEAPHAWGAAGGALERWFYSHSMVAGGLLEMSYTTREMPATSLTMRRETSSRNSYGRRAQCAVMKSTVSTARSAIT